MAILKINENPTISDTIVFEITTKDIKNCNLFTPYKINSFVIYYVERNFSGGNTKQYNQSIYDETKLKAAKDAEIVACNNPTEENIAAAKRLKEESESNVSTNPFFFNDARPVHVVGNSSYPAWLSTDLDNAFLELVDTGSFTYTWTPHGMREGDYFVCWTWTPLAAGDSFSDHLKFSLTGDTQVTTSIPTHFTDPKKYPTLLERYTPEMFKMMICSSDRTPDVLDKLNKSIASGFNLLENLTNQLVDLQDANSIHEALIPNLSNLFGLKLKTEDPTKWRGQIKRAVPLNKMKGTKKALLEAMEQAGARVLKLEQLWQVISSYTWQQEFKYNGSLEFTLEKNALPVDLDNFELWMKPAGEEWIELSSDYVEFSTDVDGNSILTWIGSDLEVDPIDLIDGDKIRVLYLINEVPDETAQNLESYVRLLPLMDQRDDDAQEYPPKNWNVRLIAYDDPLFSLIVPDRHPFHDFLIYGKVRTEFPYSENIYNMDEYNGSIRNSKNPCDIDKSFVDPCSACISSCYNIDVEIENLADDRIQEVRQVLREYTPFHSVLHTLNFVGGINEFMQPPTEEIEILISYSGEDFIIAGDGQTYFNRIMKLVETNGILRSELADSFEVLSPTSAIAYNDYIVVFCPELKLEDLGIAKNGTASIEIKSPSSLAGDYSVGETSGNTIKLTSGSLEPIDNCNNFFEVDGTLNSCAFVFDINNPVDAINGTLCNILQDNQYVIKKKEEDFGLLGVQTLVDVEDGDAASAFQILIPDYRVTAYDILDILPNGDLVINNEHDGTLPSSSASDVDFSILNGVTTVLAGTSDLEVRNRGLVTALNSSALPIQDTLRINENYYQKISGDEYLITEFKDTDKYYIENYQGGSTNGVTVLINQKIVKERIGYLSHRGINLKISGNIEQSLGIQNGTNSYVVAADGIENDGFKENFIVLVDGESYWIKEIDGLTPTGYTTINLSGTDKYWKTLSAGGTSVTVSIYQYSKNGATIDGQRFNLPEHTFGKIDRNGQPVITGTLDTEEIVASLSNNDNVVETVQQNENVSFTIEYEDGTIEERTI
ncbi:MAG: hypothetical protein EKK64_05810 [Neisseriaceae bacterium]|nr:MAG: hypothetical protein EKK64_05810 [Neisseriaceae bacterium]